MKIQTPPGMRDFYPGDMRLQNWLFDAWRGVSQRFGFEEYEGPIFEFLDLYRLKSGAGIVSELFSFQDRGEREFAIRPEMTPTLARMVAAHANALPRPIKWFSIPRMCRAEKPQRGRLREFFQWNVDILGPEETLADAEILACAVALFAALGVSRDTVELRLSSRPLVTAALEQLGIAEIDNDKAFVLIDRVDKLGPEAFEAAWAEAYGERVKAQTVLDFLESTTRAECQRMAADAGEAGAAAVAQFEGLWEQLDAFGIADFCRFDLKTVRGLSYYTGTVFEAHAKAGGLRALLGGGRYDDLTGLLDGPRVPGVGFGMGDAPVIEFLRELDALPSIEPTLDVFVIDADRELFAEALRITATLREVGLRADFSYKRQNVGKQFKQASSRGARFAVLVGAELREQRRVAVKNLETGEQREVAVGEVARAILGT